MTERSSGGAFPPRVRAFLQGTWPYLLGLAVLTLFLAWLTRNDPNILLIVLATGGLYLGVRRWSALSRYAEENLVVAIVVLGVLGLLGYLAGWSWSYLFNVAVIILIFALFSLGLNLEIGHTGIINFGHVAFMGIGAYTATLLSLRWSHLVPRLTGPNVTSLLLFAASLLLVFTVVAVLANVAAEGLLARLTTWSRDRRRRVAFWSGPLAGGAAAVALALVVNYPFSPLWAQAYLVATTVVLGMLLAALVGILLGIPTLRLREDYLAIVTIGAAEILRRIWLNEEWLTGGPRGVIGFPVLLSNAADQWGWVAWVADRLMLTNPYKILLLLMVAAAVLLVFWTYEILVRSPYGRVLKAIREDEEVASALGKNVFVYKLQALALGSAVAALSGAFLAWQNVYINHETFLPLITFYAYIILVLGGTGNNKGTILGAVILWTFFEASRFLQLGRALGLEPAQAAPFRIVLIGVLLILFMMFKPEGILGRREEMVLGD